MAQLQLRGAVLCMPQPGYMWLKACTYSALHPPMRPICGQGCVTGQAVRSRVHVYCHSNCDRISKDVLLLTVGADPSANSTIPTQHDKLSTSTPQTPPPPPVLIIHAATTSTYPVMMYQRWNYALDFMAAHPPPFRITSGRLAYMTPGYQPQPWLVSCCKLWTGAKVWATAALLRWVGAMSLCITCCMV